MECVYDTTKITLDPAKGDGNIKKFATKTQLMMVVWKQSIFIKLIQVKEFVNIKV